VPRCRCLLHLGITNYIRPVPRLAFIRPLVPSAAVHPPKGDDWLHAVKFDVYRVQLHTRAARTPTWGR
jgi:ATP-dependent DNA ligase